MSEFDRPHGRHEQTRAERVSSIIHGIVDQIRYETPSEHFRADISPVPERVKPWMAETVIIEGTDLAQQQFEGLVSGWDAHGIYHFPSERFGMPE